LKREYEIKNPNFKTGSVGLKVLDNDLGTLVIKWLDGL
jgi:hypothetical protein